MRLCSALIVVVLWLGAPAVRADDVPDATTLLDRMQIAGGTAPENVRSVIRGHGSDGDTLETIYRIGKNVRRVWNDGPITTEDGTYDGDDWTRDANGLTVLDEPDPDDASGGAVPVPTVTRSTAPDAYVIERLGKNGYGKRTFVDPATYLVMREETIRATRTDTTTYTAYRTFGTATVATKWTTSDSATSTSIDYERTEYALGAVAPADLQPPAPRKIFTLPDSLSQAVLPTDLTAAKSGCMPISPVTGRSSPSTPAQPG